MEAIVDMLSRSDRVVVIVHTHADFDSVGAAVGLATTLEATVDIATPGDVQAEAESLLREQSVVSDPTLSAYDLQIVVDAPSKQRIAPLDPTGTGTPLVVIDHHEPDDLQSHATASYIDTESPATALLVADVLRDGDWELPPVAAQALAAGVLDDTGFRAVVLPDTQQRTIELLERANDATNTLATLWDTEVAWGERMATAKAVVRARGYKAGRTILLITRVGGEETAAAQSLLDANADIAVVISNRGDRTRVVARTAASAPPELSLPEDLLRPLAADVGGDGGGHAGAGIAKLDSPDEDAIENHVVDQLEEALGVQFGGFS